MPRDILQSNLLNAQPAPRGARHARAQRRNAVRAQTLKQKRKLLAQRKKAAVKAARDRFGDVWRMRKNVLIAKFNQITR